MPIVVDSMMMMMSWWRKIQAISGLGFGIFLILHLMSHISNIISQQAGNATLRTVRVLYQNPLGETLLVLSLIVHSISNVVLYGQRQRVLQRATKKRSSSSSISPLTTLIESHSYDDNDENKTKRLVTTKELWAHRIAGYLLSILVVGHVFAVRISPILTLGALHEGGNKAAALEAAKIYDYTMIYLSAQNFGGLFVVYLVMLAIMGIWHATYGTLSAIATLWGHNSTTIHGKPFPQEATEVAAFVSLLVLNGVLAMIGWHHYEVQVSEATALAHYAILIYTLPPSIFLGIVKTN